MSVASETGTQFIVSHASVRLIQVVLPRFFEHSSIHSFTRECCSCLAPTATQSTDGHDAADLPIPKSGQLNVRIALFKIVRLGVPTDPTDSELWCCSWQVYGFSRLSQNELSAILDLDSTADFSAWRHPLFKREDPASLVTMTPKPSRARAQKKAEKDARLRQEDDERRASRSGTSCGQSSSWA